MQKKKSRVSHFRLTASLILETTVLRTLVDSGLQHSTKASSMIELVVKFTIATHIRGIVDYNYTIKCILAEEVVSNIQDLIKENAVTTSHAHQLPTMIANL